MKLSSATLALFALLTGTASQAFANANPATVVLGGAGNYIVLAETGITTVPGTPSIPDTTITGDIGVYTGTDASLTGFGQSPATADASTVFSTSPMVSGKIYAANYINPTPIDLNNAVNAMTGAFGDAYGRNPGDIVLDLNAGTIGAPQGALPRGVYNWSTDLNITSDLTLFGTATDVWIFQVAGKLDMASTTHILLTGGALASNVFWAVAGASTTLHANSDFSGNILTSKYIAMESHAALHGKALAQTAVTLIGNSIDPGVVVVGTPTNSPTPSASPTATPSNSPSPSPSGTPTASPSATPSATPSASPTATPSNTDSGSPTNTPTATPTATPSGTPSASPSLTPSGTANLTPQAFQKVILGSADGFSVLAGSGITIPGSSSVNGYVGTYPTTTEAGAGTLSSSCTDHGGDAFTQAAKNDLLLAYDDVSTRPSTTIPVELGGQTLLPGAYSQTSLQLTSGVLTLDGNGDTNSVFTFYTGISTLTTAAGGSFSLTNGALAKNVFFAVGSSATLGVGSHFVGTIIALQSITLVTNATVEGRVLAINGAVTMDSNNINTATSALVPCSGGTTATPSGTPSATPSATRSSTSTVTPTATPSSSPSVTANGTFTHSPTALGTFTHTPTALGTYTASPTPNLSLTPTSTPPVVSVLPTVGTHDSYIYPSPARGDSADLVYYVKQPAQVTLTIFNQTGRLVDTIRDGKGTGWQSSHVSVGKFAPGTYYYVVVENYDAGGRDADAPGKFVVLH